MHESQHKRHHCQLKDTEKYYGTISCSPKLEHLVGNIIFKVHWKHSIFLLHDQYLLCKAEKVVHSSLNETYSLREASTAKRTTLVPP